jgi:predicted metalloprotease
VGHHVQNELGILDRIHAQMSRVAQTESNRHARSLSTQRGLPGWGLWAHYADASSKLLEAGDLEEEALTPPAPSATTPYRNGRAAT